ncbi:VOC family protein [Paraburkholderia sp. SIMBA_054]|uniref:VOC family protein n=1 Tax=Paraburkholderia sp. SIMBA_054 TaxID=3085795 RepID=UPI00397C2CE9
MNSASATAAAHPGLFSIRSVDHTGITVSSLQESLDFWTNVLGFEHLYTWQFENSPFVENLVGVAGASLDLAMVKGYGHQIELLEYHSPADRRILKPRSCDVGSVHVAMYVDDLDAVVKRLDEANWTAVGPAQQIEGGARDGWKLVYVRDPDGVTLEFLQPATHSVTSD